MKLATQLTGQNVQNYIRETGIDPNHWYPLGWAYRFKQGEVVPVTVWQQPMAVFRDSHGKIHALEDACPHKGVELHQGKVDGDNLLCPYHGWKFNGAGQCVNIPYYPADQKLPCAQARSYPVREQYGIAWVFPGDPDLAETCAPPQVPEYGDDNWLMIPITGHFGAHFSIANENAMDVFHGFLHEDLQGWFDPVLLDLQQSEGLVKADYRVSYKGQMAKFLGIAETADEVTSRVISVRYRYPHYYSSLEGVSSIHLMRLPVSPTETRSFALFFLKIRLPKWLLSVIKKPLVLFVERVLFQRFLDQDIGMMESEQRNYLRNRQRRYVEVNPAILALQRTITQQYENYMQQSKTITDRDAESRPTVTPTQEDASSLTP
ncbi:MAG: aromatic ring-hydroxylating dioxygenase subunit alpha [Oscillatoriales cyanobacterium]|jgi:renierapurpurin 18,18'-hydroxylase|nr:MAG: aromatic ring-hydroxylating dioxygenase subunit alpha [Oscillatoriales cyanobacterium]